MTKEEIKRFISERIGQGLSLSKIQDELNTKEVRMTFMELRLIASEIDTEELSKLDKPEPKAEKEPEQPAEEALPEEAAEPEEAMEEAVPEDTAEEAPEEAPADDKVRGATTVEVSKLAMPGMYMNGSVTFGSGVKADWYLDQMGRLGLDNVQGGKPDQKDIEEFQIELRKKLGA